MTGPASPGVCVVVSTHNAGPWLSATLESVFSQTLDGVQVVVVDDGSTDGTPRRVRRDWPAVELIEQANSGVSTARNRGLAAAKAPLICFLDQDDLWHPQHLQRQVAVLRQRPEVAGVATPYQFWRPGADGAHAAPEWPDDPGGVPLVPGYEGWTYHCFLQDCWALTSATMLRTDIVRELQGFDETLPYSEDWDLWLRISLRHPFVQLAWPPVMYRQHAAQGSRVARAVDYRTELLLRYASKHGLRSADGQSLDPRQFAEQVAAYHMEFGYHQLQWGSRLGGIRALLRAWLMRPVRLRWLLLALCASLGWRPRSRPGTPPTPR